ncbi:MAG: transcriptional regulator [Deltaproteobacteria bacterium HGW-Deltaproteobacteria-23]|jgi:phosphomannomutase|nr:MAG: transcriptional regulator [Deltaproteobacteria bacterium HGW-Deltaproteobacteria-23]
MPEISRFYGIIIAMFHDEHNPPHFHARYGSDRISIRINDLSIIGGALPPRALGIVMEWASIHQEELLQNWDRAINYKPLEPVEPLK